MTEKSNSRRDVLKGLGVASTVAVAGCTGGGDDGDEDTVRAAFAYPGELRDLGWTAAHDEARLTIDEHDWVETEYSDGVGQDTAARTFEQWAEDGVDVIFGCTFEHMDPMYDVSMDYPDTAFEHCSGYRQNENMGRYYGRRYQTQYLCGAAAGHVTEADTLGYVAAIPIPEVIRQLNAFAAGAAAVNDDVSMIVRWINAWEDPPQARDAANTLVDEGVDVVVNHMDSPAAAEAAASNEVWASVTDTPMPEIGGDYYLGSAAFDWAAFYEPTVEAIRDGEWEPNWEWGGLESGVAYADLSDNLPDDVVENVREMEDELISGERTVWEGTQYEGWDDEALFGEPETYIDAVEGEVPS